MPKVIAVLNQKGGVGEDSVPVIEQAVCQRVSFAETAAAGRTVYDLSPDGGFARTEIDTDAGDVRRLVA